MSRLNANEVARAKSLTDTLVDKGAPHLPLPMYYVTETRRGKGSLHFTVEVSIEHPEKGILGYGLASGTYPTPGADVSRGTAWGKLCQTFFPKAVEAAKIAYTDMLANELADEFGIRRI